MLAQHGLVAAAEAPVDLSDLADAVVTQVAAPKRGLVPAEALRQRVLVVDDNVDAADVISLLLESAGCDVRTVYEGEAAIREVEAFRPEVALVDLGLPDLDGRDVCRRMRSLPWGPRMVIIALTGWGRDDDRLSTTLAGFDHHLLKPVDPDALVRLLGELTRPSEA